MYKAHPGAKAARANDRIDLESDYAVCAWARHFNVSEQRVKEAVAAVGDRAHSVGEHLNGARAPSTGVSERPSSH
jgi:hypothetical protein